MGAKSRFTFFVNDVQKATEIIEGFLSLHHYEEQHANGVSWYMHSTPMANFSFDYSITDNTLDILANLGTPDSSSPLDDGIIGSMYKKEYLEELQYLFQELISLSSNSEIPAGVVVHDRDAHNGACSQVTQHINAAHNRRIDTLEPKTVDTDRFCQESTVNVDKHSYITGTNTAHKRQINKAQPSPYMQSSGSDSDMRITTDSNSKFAVIALCLSIVTLLTTMCFHYMVGVVLQIITYVLGVKGLKSQQKKLAVIAIVINVFSTISILLMFLLSILILM